VLKPTRHQVHTGGGEELFRTAAECEGRSGIAGIGIQKTEFRSLGIRVPWNSSVREPKKARILEVIFPKAAYRDF
jgi:hypothetical protein